MINICYDRLNGVITFHTGRYDRFHNWGWETYWFYNLREAKQKFRKDHNLEHKKINFIELDYS